MHQWETEFPRIQISIRWGGKKKKKKTTMTPKETDFPTVHM